MASYIVIIALLSVAYTIVNGIVCIDDICSNKKCAAVEDCNGPNQLIKKGGFCNCCDVCYQLIDEDEVCDPSPTRRLVGSPPPTIICREGLFCYEGVCQKKEKILKKTL